jgi:ethanolamine utilization microcompartment shell protein EutL
MAEITTYALSDVLVPQLEEGKITFIEKEFSLAAGNNGDTITIVDDGVSRRVVDCYLSVSGTLGAACTLAARHNSTAVTGTTTAAAASVVRQSSNYPPAASTGKLDLVIGGANVAATATVKVIFAVLTNP